MPHLYISATHKSSGKTMVAAGLAAALTARGLRAQTFKKGPDYIDPQWLALASGRACYNLDFNTQSPAEIRAAFSRAAGADAVLVEGNKGLYDGMDLEGSDCNAAMAKLLGTPVILVIDVEGMTRGAAPLLIGYQAFDPELTIAGVILNRVASPRQEAKLRQTIARYTALEVLGALPRARELAVAERHLGLTTPSEAGAEEHGAALAGLAEAVESAIDLDRLLELGRRARPLAPARSLGAARRASVRIAVARDSAFNFYYADDLEALQAAGAELTFFSPLTDARVPEADGLLIGGGFPETHMAALEANRALRANVRALIAGGLPAYAECGGLMYLCRAIRWGAERREMADVIPADAVMGARPQGHGLVSLAETGAAPWGFLAAGGGAARARLPAHEFHYAGLENLAPSAVFAYRMARGHGVGDGCDGFVINNLLASFSHLRHTVQTPWAENFVGFIRRCKAQTRTPLRASA